jgi:TetR/AcrR family transcriptional regulator, cholesterol catabolism regulator
VSRQPSVERAELTARGESTRERIIHSAARVLARSGYAAATLTEIAQTADTKAGSIYHYFDSRESLIREVMTRGITETLDHVGAALDSLAAGASSRDRLSAVIRAHVEYVLSGSDIARASIRILGQVPEDVEGPAIELHRQYGALLSMLISDAARDGYLPPYLDERLLRLLLVGAANWTTTWYDPAGPASAQKVGETLVALIFGPSRSAASPSVAFGAHGRRRHPTATPQP